MLTDEIAERIIWFTKENTLNSDELYGGTLMFLHQNGIEYFTSSPGNKDMKLTPVAKLVLDLAFAHYNARN